MLIKLKLQPERSPDGPRCINCITVIACDSHGSILKSVSRELEEPWKATAAEIDPGQFPYGHDIEIYGGRAFCRDAPEV